MATYVEYSIDQGSTFEAEIEVGDALSSNISLLGYTAYGAIRKSYTFGDHVPFTCSITDAEGGKFRISLTSNQTRSLKAGRYVHDVFLVSDSTGTAFRVLEGQIEITPGVTVFPEDDEILDDSGQPLLDDSE